MYPFLRLVRVLLSGRAAAKGSLLDESSVAFRVMPTDLDTSVHLNNGRYLTMMDLARFDLIMRAGLFREMWKRKWIPVVHSSTIRYMRSIEAWERYEIRSQVVGWDEQGVFIVQRFVKKDETVAAVAVMKGVFRCKGRTVSPDEIAEVAGYHDAPPTLPEWVAEWQTALGDLRGPRNVTVA